MIVRVNAVLNRTVVSTFGVLRYFDPAEETVIQTDASLQGPSAILLQNGQPVCYASKTLTKITVTLSMKH